MPGLLLDQESVAAVAGSVFDEFLKQGGAVEGSLQKMLSVLTHPVRDHGLDFVAKARADAEDPDLYRDRSRARWERNPRLEKLKLRGKEGELTSREWSRAEGILWQAALPSYRKFRLNEADSKDAYAIVLADFLKARTDLESCPLQKLRIFEELPRLFAVAAERRAISWMRHQSAKKNQPHQSGLSFDHPDLGLAGQISDHSTEGPDVSLMEAGFEKIKEVCGEALSPFQWHLVQVLFVDGSATREDLALDEEILEAVGAAPDASRSTKLRRINAELARVLSTLGQAIAEADGLER